MRTERTGGYYVVLVKNTDRSSTKVNWRQAFNNTDTSSTNPHSWQRFHGQHPSFAYVSRSIWVSILVLQCLSYLVGKVECYQGALTTASTRKQRFQSTGENCHIHVISQTPLWDDLHYYLIKYQYSITTTNIRRQHISNGITSNGISDDNTYLTNVSRFED